MTLHPYFILACFGFSSTFRDSFIRFFWGRWGNLSSYNKPSFGYKAVKKSAIEATLSESEETFTTALQFAVHQYLDFSVARALSFVRLIFGD